VSYLCGAHFGDIRIPSTSFIFTSLSPPAKNSKEKLATSLILKTYLGLSMTFIGSSVFSTVLGSAGLGVAFWDWPKLSFDWMGPWGFG